MCSSTDAPRPAGAVTVIATVAMSLMILSSGARAHAEDAPGDAAAMAERVTFLERADARALAVHDARGLLAVAYTDDDRAAVALYQLDDAGDIVNADDPATHTLPRPDDLDDYAHQPLALRFHPELPVLYVWQDLVDADDEDEDLREKVHEQFDHLLVLEADDDALTQRNAFGRSAELAFGQSAAALAVSGDGERLFVPNFYGTDEHDVRIGGIGYFDLDDEGDLQPVPVPIEGSLDGRGLSEFDMKLKPTSVYTGFRRTRTDSWGRYGGRMPTHSMVAPTRRTVLFDVRSGVGVWDTEDRQQALSEINLRGAWPRTDGYLALHPDRPLFYALVADGERILRMEHVVGFPTLLPRVSEVADVEFVSEPVIYNGERHGLAVGSGNDLALIDLDDDGMPGTAAHIVETEVAGDLRAFDYAASHDRIYVAVDKVPEPEEEPDDE